MLRILADGQIHSAKQLINQLALSSIAELELAISTLFDLGIKFYSPRADTYQLISTLELLDRSCILAALPVNNQQRLALLEIHSVLDSTNQYVLAQQHQVVPYVCLAEYQTAGRGRQGRQWISPYGSGLCLSIKQYYETINKSLTGLNIALAVTVVRVLSLIGATEVGLKWPNDILWRGHKLAGLLLETRYKKGCEIVIGIGINVKSPPISKNTITQPWVDLYTILGQPISRNVLAAMLIDHCLQTLIIYPQVGLTAFLDDWHNFDLSYGQTVTLSKQAEVITGTAWGIDDEEGSLLLQVGNEKRRFVCGEVSLRL
ncbi:biotin--[acetyl-CoA-carboxylase] ligase [Candidatus Parabeggiatoa sp. HSG14]|uniref:biotin--[acetyl-CoA-carboxylase] ligase n=1 Tax=Candidatus Parabeggiatoa sp. HSG14 TaxID=3055593 RepID=UPI0032E3E25E